MLLAPHPTTNLEDHLLSAVRNCLFNILVAIFHIGDKLLHQQPENAPYLGDRDPFIEGKDHKTNTIYLRGIDILYLSQMPEDQVFQREDEMWNEVPVLTQAGLVT
jgi:hypothetical protein